jgi:hypothetical protein
MFSRAEGALELRRDLKRAQISRDLEQDSLDFQTTLARRDDVMVLGLRYEGLRQQGL